jgi:hypothetical protein
MVIMLIITVQVNRAVTVMGHPATMPIINGTYAERCFRVGEGGYLELRFVGISQVGGGALRAHTQGRVVCVHTEVLSRVACPCAGRRCGAGPLRLPSGGP